MAYNELHSARNIAFKHASFQKKRGKLTENREPRRRHDDSPKSNMGVSRPKTLVQPVMTDEVSDVSFLSARGYSLAEHTKEQWKSGKSIRVRTFSLLQSWKAINMNVPKEIHTYCPKCKTHQAHSVSLYKAGKRRALAKGERHHKREKKGYGGQKYPLQREFAKTTKKQTLRLKCKKCGYMHHKDGVRLRKLTIT